MSATGSERLCHLSPLIRAVPSTAGSEFACFVHELEFAPRSWDPWRDSLLLFKKYFKIKFHNVCIFHQCDNVRGGSHAHGQNSKEIFTRMNDEKEMGNKYWGCPVKVLMWPINLSQLPWPSDGIGVLAP